MFVTTNMIDPIKINFSSILELGFVLNILGFLRAFKELLHL